MKLKTCCVLFFILNLILTANLALPSLSAVESSAPKSNRTRGVTSRLFGQTREGKPVTAFELTNANGVRAVILNFGGVIYSMEVPDRNGKFDNVSLNFPKISDYQEKRALFGSLVGRFANRIARGEFTIDGIPYKVYPYNGKTSIHGGKIGFDQVIWNARPVTEAQQVGVILNYTAKDGEEGFPGNLNVTVKYSLTDRDELVLDYSATTDKPTPLNLTNHCYWNLAGAFAGTALDHQMQSPATHVLCADDGLIPTGDLRPVKGTPVDFQKLKTFRRDQNKITEPQFRGGFDHSLILPAPLNEGKPQLGALVIDPKSGRALEVLTTEPDVHLYTANGLNVKSGSHVFKPYDAFCIECQHYPDSPNHPEFPDTILRPGQKYRQTTIYRFFVLKK